MAQENYIRQEEITVQESIQVVQNTTLAVLSTIAYLRDLFPEEAFQDFHFAELPLKRLKWGAMPEADIFLNWIEVGCFDAIGKNYLKEIVFGINCDPMQSSYVTETFSINVHCLQSPTIFTKPMLQFEHKNSFTQDSTIFKSESGISMLDINRNINKLLKSVCLIVQQLQQLPESKCVSMKLYYNDSVPETYQPPFFKESACAEDSFFKITDESEAICFIFGTTSTPFHGLELRMKTVKNDKSPTASIQATPTLTLLPASQNLFSQIPEMPLNNLNSFHLVEKMQKMEKAKDVGLVRCSCDDEMTEGDMIMCDFCGFWQHCICMGFLNLQDRRIPDGPFKCYGCGYPQGHEIRNFLRSHCIFRRTISYALQEGIDGTSTLAKKLSVCQTTAKKFIDRLVKEGFVEKSIAKDASQRRFPKIYYKTIRTDAVKRAASEYFLTPIEENPQFKIILKNLKKFSASRKNSSKFKC